MPAAISDAKLNIAVIGAGLGGLIAASELATRQPSAKITIFEAGPQPGGRARTTVQDGFSLNQGAHALYRGGDTMAFFKKLGLAVPGLPPNTFDGVAMRGSELHVLPLSPQDMIKTKLFATGEKMEMAGFLLGLAKVDQKSLAHTSARTWIDSVSKNLQIRQFLAALLRLCTYCNDLDSLSAGAAAGQFILSQGGVLYVDGGWQTLVDGLVSHLHKSATTNINFKYETRVDSIKKAGEKLTVTACGDASSLTFDAVILAVPPPVLLDILKEMPEALPENPLESLHGSAVACLDICLSQAPVEKTQYGLGIDKPLYYSMHSKAAKLTPTPEQALIQMSYYLSPEEVDKDKSDPDNASKYEQIMLDFLAKLQPGYQDKLVYKRYLPMMKASYGLPLARAGGCLGLASPQTKISNLFVCGDHVGFNKFLADATTTSAVLAAEQLVQWADRALALAADVG